MPAERITRAAAELFYRRGIHATDVGLLAREAQISKRMSYQHFSRRTELVEDYLRTIDAAGGSPMERRLDTSDLRPRDRLLAVFDGSTSHRFRGCPFHNAAAAQLIDSACAATEG